MSNKLLIFLCLITSILMHGCSFTSRLSQDEIQTTVSKAKNSKIIVLDVYHNRCESCKQIEPIIEKLRSDYAGNSDLAFLKYDLSNPFTIFDSRKIAKELNLENIYKVQRFSGVVLIIDSKTNEILDTLISESDIQKYYGTIQKNLAFNET